MENNEIKTLKEFVSTLVVETVDGCTDICFNKEQMNEATEEASRELLTDATFVSMLKTGTVNLDDSKVRDALSNAVAVGIGSAEALA